MVKTTYYQRNREIMLNTAKEINIETYPKKIKRKRENMEKKDIEICLKKRSKN